MRAAALPRKMPGVPSWPTPRGMSLARSISTRRDSIRTPWRRSARSSSRSSATLPRRSGATSSADRLLNLRLALQHRDAAAADGGADAVRGAAGGDAQQARAAHLHALDDLGLS